MGRYTLPECVAVGLLIATLVGGVGAILVGVGAADDVARAGLSLSELLVGYLVGGLLGPLIFWALQPLTASRLGAALVGFLVLLPVSLCFAAFVSEEVLPLYARIGGAFFSASAGAILGFLEGGT